MKARLWLLFASLLFASSFMGLVSAQTGQIYLKEDFNYSSLDQMQAADWTFTRPSGISVAAGAVTLDGTNGDCTISRATSFSSNVYDWKAEVRAMWLGQGHSVLSVFVGTAEHSYGWAADGYYKEYSFYRDSQKILHFGNYAEKANEYVVLTMVREGNTFSFYFNGNLINTYTEEDTAPSEVTSLALVSPWRGDAKYDYYQIGEPNAVVVPSTPSEVAGSFPLVPVLIGGGITAAIVGGIVVFYFFVAGGHAGASAGSAVGSVGVGEHSVIEDHPISPLSGEKPPQPLYQNLPIDILQISQNKPVIRTETDANGYKTNYYSDGTSIRYDPSGTACAAFNANGELIYTPSDPQMNPVIRTETDANGYKTNYYSDGTSIRYDPSGTACAAFNANGELIYTPSDPQMNPVIRTETDANGYKTNYYSDGTSIRYDPSGTACAAFNANGELIYTPSDPQMNPVIRTETDANGYKTNYYSDGTSIRYDPSGTACAAFNANGELIYTPSDPQMNPVIRTETDANGYKTNYYSDGTSIRYDPSGTACAAFNANGELIYTPQDTNTNTNQSQDTSNQTNNSDSGQSTNESE